MIGIGRVRCFVTSESHKASHVGELDGLSH